MLSHEQVKYTMSKHRRQKRVNGTKYCLTIVETSRRQRVSVYPPRSELRKSKQHRKKNDLVYEHQWRGTVKWLGPDKSQPIERMVAEALSEAVMIYEDRQDDDGRDSIDRAMEEVAEALEDE